MNTQILSGAVQSKFWGKTQSIFAGPFSETHFLKINKGGYCSEHKHKNKWNRFFLISGKLKITIFRESGYDVTVLLPGEFTDVPPGVFHNFEAEEDSMCMEIYWIDSIETNDIERRSVGGIKN